MLRAGLFVLVLVGLGLLVRARRGRLRLAPAHCGACGYALRGLAVSRGTLCPERGIDLWEPGAVHFAARARSRHELVLSLALLLPALGVFVGVLARAPAPRVLVMPAPGGVGTKTNAELLADLPAVADEPWHWNEPSARANDGILSKAEAAAAIEALIDAAGQPSFRRTQVLLHAAHFDASARAPGMITDEQRHRLGRFATNGNGTVRREPLVLGDDVMLPPDLETVTVVLVPDPEGVETEPTLDRIWSGTLRFETVPVIDAAEH